MGDGRAAGRGGHRDRRHQGRRRRSRRRRLHQHRGHRPGARRASTSGRTGHGPATSSSSAATSALHGMAVMSVREGLEFGTEVETDCAPLNGLVAAMLAAGADLHVPARSHPRRAWRPRSTRSRSASGVGVSSRRERRAGARRGARGAAASSAWTRCYVANEGKLVAFVRAADADRALAAMRGATVRRGAAVIGTVAASTPAWSSRGPASAARVWSTCRSRAAAPHLLIRT